VFICDACVRWPKASMSTDMLDLLRRIQDENVINRYMLRSLISGNNCWRVCDHDVTQRRRVSRSMSMLLYLRMDEVLELAKWFVNGLVTRAFIFEDLLQCSKYEEVDTLDAFLLECLGGCARAQFAARAMFKSLNVHFVFNSFEIETSLTTSTAELARSSEYLKIMYSRGRSAVDFLLRPTVDQKFFVDLGEVLFDSIGRRDPRDIDLRCTCRATTPTTPYCMAFTVNGLEKMFASETSTPILNYNKMSSTLGALMKVSQN